MDIGLGLVIGLGMGLVLSFGIFSQYYPGLFHPHNTTVMRKQPKVHVSRLIFFVMTTAVNRNFLSSSFLSPVTCASIGAWS